MRNWRDVKGGVVNPQKLSFDVTATSHRPPGGQLEQLCLLTVVTNLRNVRFVYLLVSYSVLMSKDPLNNVYMLYGHDSHLATSEMRKSYPSSRFFLLFVFECNVLKLMGHVYFDCSGIRISFATRNRPLLCK